ncbi:hypothetical protein POM88_033113 [Heracleum sosnowskyi]|uniref:Uncharacterized protein n=1 Tax=Heracleum sosnowskyi TaxID=360622 RepID=A0AAD8MI61_9APIA|nr:hypothetical protein POM88_033113 [Heracleum sosnowskyi]
MMVSENAENNVGEASNRANTSSGDETFQTRENRKRKESEGSCSETLDDAEDESNVPKKKSFSWTSEMHRKFMDAIAQIGEDRAFPKTIVEVMNQDLRGKMLLAICRIVGEEIHMHKISSAILYEKGKEKSYIVHVIDTLLKPIHHSQRSTAVF